MSVCAQPVIALKGITIIDAHHHHPYPGQTVIIQNKIITDIFADNARKIPDSATVFNLAGKFLIPGLIDTHVHLATDPSGADSRQKTLGTLQSMLLSGVTTVRDMAGDARTLASLARDAKAGDIPSPDIFYSALMAGPVFFTDPRTQTSTVGGIAGAMPYMMAVSDSTDLKIAVAEAKGTGASGIKLYKNLSAPMVDRILTEAKKQQMPVWAHAYLFPAKPSELVTAGVGSLSHSPLLIYEKMDKIPASWKGKQHTEQFWKDSLPDLSSLFKLMVQRHVILDATMLTYKKWTEEDSTMSYEYEITKRLTAQAYKSGVSICAGTDDDQREFVTAEMKLLVRDAGMSPADALDAATITAARALLIADRKGAIEIGKDADLVILRANPILNIDNIDSVEMVIKSGRIFRALK